VGLMRISTTVLRPVSFAVAVTVYGLLFLAIRARRGLGAPTGQGATGVVALSKTLNGQEDAAALLNIAAVPVRELLVQARTALHGIR
jgi:hypothetical protein